VCTCVPRAHLWRDARCARRTLRWRNNLAGPMGRTKLSIQTMGTGIWLVGALHRAMSFRLTLELSDIADWLDRKGPGGMHFPGTSRFASETANRRALKCRGHSGPGSADAEHIND